MPVRPDQPRLVSREGVPIATFRALAAAANSGVGVVFGVDAGAWELAPAGEAAGWSIDPDHPRLRAPDMRPPGWIGVEAIGGTEDGEFSSALLPWFGEIHHPRGIGGATVSVAADRRLSLRTIVNQHPRELRVYGGDTAVAVGDTVELRAVIAP